MSLMSLSPMEVSASLDCANQLHLGTVMDQLVSAGIRTMHIDIMDGRFVPNIAYGTSFLKSVQQRKDIQLDLHLMVEDPEFFVASWTQMGLQVDSISFHLEACRRPFQLMDRIRQISKHVAVAINPITPVEQLTPLLSLVDRVVVMSVDPGFPGQKFIPHSFERIQQVRALQLQHHRPVNIQVDGAVGWDLLDRLRVCGATSIVAGTSTLFARDHDLSVQASKLHQLWQVQPQAML